MRLLLLLLVGFLASCNHSNKQSLKVAATSVPHGEILEFIKPDLEKEGINLQIIITDDYQLPNRLLDEGEVDANFFQHLPFLESQKKIYGNRLEMLVATHYEPLGIFSDHLNSLDDLKEDAVVAIPSDPSNEDRALKLLNYKGIIKTKEGKQLLSSLDLIENPKKLRLVEVDAPLLPRTLKDVDLAVIPANFALSAGLDPCKALAREEKNTEYRNIVVIKRGKENDPQLQALKRAITSQKTKEFILEHYKCAVQPAF